MFFTLFCSILYHLHNLKLVKNTHGGVLLFKKLQVLDCNFTKSNIPSWVFFTFFTLYKWYQITQYVSLSILFPSLILTDLHLYLEPYCGHAFLLLTLSEYHQQKNIVTQMYRWNYHCTLFIFIFITKCSPLSLLLTNDVQP